MLSRRPLASLSLNPPPKLSVTKLSSTLEQRSQLVPVSVSVKTASVMRNWKSSREVLAISIVQTLSSLSVLSFAPHPTPLVCLALPWRRCMSMRSLRERTRTCPVLSATTSLAHLEKMQTRLHTLWGSSSVTLTCSLLVRRRNLAQEAMPRVTSLVAAFSTLRRCETQLQARSPSPLTVSVRQSSSHLL